EETVEALRASFRSRSRIVEAWVLGNRIVPLDGSSPYDAVFVGLGLDPPLSDQSREAKRDDFVALTVQLDSETGFGREPDRGWQIVDRPPDRAPRPTRRPHPRRPPSRRMNRAGILERFTVRASAGSSLAR